MSKKYVLSPGFVYSSNDNQRHYIGPVQLARLYGVNMAECDIYEPAPWWTTSRFQAAEKLHEGKITLIPKGNGDYSLPVLRA